MTHGSAHAVRAGVAAADDDDVFASGVDERGLAIQQRLGVAVQKLHREVNALERTALNGQVTRLRRTGAEHDSVEIVHELL